MSVLNETSREAVENTSQKTRIDFKKLILEIKKFQKIKNLRAEIKIQMVKLRKSPQQKKNRTKVRR